MLNLDKFRQLNHITCVGLGEVLFDVYPQGPKLGGAPANFAFHCGQLGLKSMVISAVGQDDLGERARQELASKFLPALLPTVPYPTGAVNVTLSSDGVPAYIFLEDTAYDHIPFTPLLAELAPKINIACFGTLAQRGSETHETVLKFLDAMSPAARLRVTLIYAATITPAKLSMIASIAAKWSSAMKMSCRSYVRWQDYQLALARAITIIIYKTRAFPA